MPSWGRPPGAKGSKRRRQWERERALWEENVRIEELDSDDTDTQGVDLGQRRFASDPLNFTGMDMAPASRARQSYGFEGGESSSDTPASGDEGSSAVQIALRDKEEALVQAALARIRRAREKGKLDVKLSQEELDALEKRRKRLEAAAKKDKKSGDSGSDKKRRSERKNLVTVPLSVVDPSSRKKSNKSKRSSSDLQSQSGSSNPPGILIPGPDGNLIYTPIGYTVPGVGSSRNSPARPRSASTQQILGQPPPFYPIGPNRHFSDGMRPGSSSSTGSRRPLPDEEGWMPGSSRRSSVSSQNFAVDPFEYQTSSGRPPHIPEQYLTQGRRIVSNPADISYSSLRRSSPVGSGYPAPNKMPASDPSLRHRSSYRDELTNSSTEDESDDLGNGVQVFVEERENERERAVSRKPVAGSVRKKGRGR